MVEKTVRLLLTAGILLMISGCIFGFIGQWIYATLVWAGAFGCWNVAQHDRQRDNQLFGCMNPVHC